MELKLVPNEDELAALKAKIDALKDALAVLDAEEPEDMMSAKYEKWADRHEILEDDLDDLLDQLAEWEESDK